MNIVIRTDASFQIGTGHVIRCLTLAEILRLQSARVIFICREHPGNLCDYIESKGFKVLRLAMPGQDEATESDCYNDQGPPHLSWLGVSWQKDADETIAILLQEETDRLIIDHFGVDISWEHRVKMSVPLKIAVIDGQFDRHHDCDFLLDPNLTENSAERWSSLVPLYCKMFIGPAFTFLRQEFIVERSHLKKRDGLIQKILIAFGGVDEHNATDLAIEAVQKADGFKFDVDVIIGAGNPHRLELEKKCRFLENVTVHSQPPQLARLMAEADLSLGAGGTMAWERCYLGLPTIMIAVADNQNEICRQLDRIGAAVCLGKLRDLQIDKIVEVINSVLMNPEWMSRMADQCMKIMGESGAGLKKFCKALLK
jgi:UDP-2,4-diacetamido-2,4,6-trideoxy-beta-L-altropyranose hydrolase